MLHRSLPRTSTVPGRPVRIVIEAEDLASLPLTVRPLAGLEVRLCSGPETEHEACPLVADGVCPFGDCDVVVSDLQGRWSEPVRRAWMGNGTVVTRSNDSSPAAVDRFDARLGAALTALYRAAYLTRTDPAEGAS